MKSQIVPVILFCIAFPWMASRVFQMGGHHETLQEGQKVLYLKESVYCNGNKAACQPVSYGELSTKQINYLIP
jgi:hypothetical protein